MKAILSLCTALVLILCVPVAGLAQFVNEDIEDADMIAAWSQQWGGATIDAGYPLDISGPGVQWAATPSVTSGWINLAVGDNYPVQPSIYGFPASAVSPYFADWTGHYAYQLAFTNNSADSWVMVKPYYTTTSIGYWHEASAWVGPGETVVVSMDLTALATGEPVNALTQVAHFGFELGTNYASPPVNDFEGDEFNVTVSAAVVPAPDVVSVDDDWAGSSDGQFVGAGQVFNYNAFATVADGIANVSGSTVNVAAGTYAEALQISTAGLELIGAGSGLVTIDAGGLAGYNGSGIHVIADNVTLQGFTLLGEPTAALPRYGVKLNQVFGCTLDDVVVKEMYRAGVDILGGGTHVINDVQAIDNNGNGLQSGDTNGIAYSNITTSGNAWGGVGVFTWGRYTPTVGTSGIVFSGTNSFGETVSDVGGLYLEEGNYNDPLNPYPITWSTNPLDGADVTIQLADFTHFMKGDTDELSPLLLYTRFYATLTDAQNAAAGVVSHILGNRYIGEIDGTNWYVPANLGGIQAAVDAASAGDVVNVDAGTFVEQVDIGQNLTLKGAGTSTVIESPAVLAVSFTTSSAKKAVVCAHDAMDVTVADLTVDGLGLGNANVQFIGVAYRNAGGTVSGCDILDIRDTPFSGSQHGVALYLYNDDLVARNIDVLGNYFEGFQKNAMALNAGGTTPLTVDVSGNTVVGAGATDITAQNGIQVWADNGSGLVFDNEISGIAYDNTAAATKWVASSILNYYTDLDIEQNTITGAHMGIYNIDGAGGIDDNDLTIEKVGVSGTGICATDPPEAVPSPFDAPEAAKAAPGVMGTAGAMSLLTVDVSGNTLAFSGVDNTDTYGIEAYAGYGSDDIAVTMTGNEVTGFDYGVVLIQLTYDTGVFTGITANQNAFYGNTSAGMYSNVDYLTVDGTCNWWGDLDGPDVPPANPSAGDALYGDIDYAPWLDGIGGVCDQYGGDYVAADPAGLCISGPTPCVTSAVEFVRTDTTPARGVTVTVELSADLALCGSGIVQGDWLDGYGFGSTFQVTDLGGGIYVVDQAVLGGTTGCGPTTGGTLFTLDVTNTGGDGSGTITVTHVDARDCGNPFALLPGIPGPPAEIRIDYTAPVAVGDLAATQVKSGNDSNGTTQIDLAWTAPPETDVATVEIYRKGFGFYPEYDDDGGAAPAAPADTTAALAAGWTKVVSLAGAASAYTDEPATRDFWYYVAFVMDNCDNLSDVSNRTGGTLNYHLGDVAVSPGDNLVAGVDISALGAAYGTVHGGANYDNEIDVGPTTDNSTNALPTTDNAIQFEDLIIFAINYGTVSKPGIKPLAADRNEIALQVGDIPAAGGLFDATVTLASDGSIQGVSVPLVWNAGVVEPAGMIAGDYLDRQSGPAQAFAPKAGTVDAAVFGATFAGEGELATIAFRVIGAGDPGIALGEVEARDAENRKVELKLTTGIGDPRTVPAITRLLPCAPNPFLGATAITFALAEDGPVTVRVYAVDGRLVRTLLQSDLPAGERSVQWDGRDDSGRDVAAGTYLLKLQAAKTSQSQRIVRLR